MKQIWLHITEDMQ